MWDNLGIHGDLEEYVNLPCLGQIAYEKLLILQGHMILF